ncbi:MAG: thioredoxin family protein [bacterium]|nr:thioredoxin family protein [bacterium]
MTLLSSLNLPLGSDIIPFSLPGVDGVVHSVESFKESKNLVVVFTCNHCPYAQATEPYLLELAHKYSVADVAFVAINSNDATTYVDDSFVAMQKRATDMEYPFPYLYDESQEVAKAYQAQCTPDIYVFDSARRLRYHGRVNNVRTKDDVAETHELQDALDVLLKGEVPNENQKSSMGCSIKWKQ